MREEEDTVVLELPRRRAKALLRFCYAASASGVSSIGPVDAAVMALEGEVLQKPSDRQGLLREAAARGRRGSAR